MTCARRWACALQRADLEEIGRLADAWAVLQVPGEPPVRGRAAMLARWSDLHARPGFSLRLAAVDRRVYPLGPVAHDVGRYRIVTVTGGRHRIERGRHLVVWHRTPRGWRVRSDLYYPAVSEGAASRAAQSA